MEEKFRDGFYINEFHRKNSMAAQQEVRRMVLHPYTREQKLEQIALLKQRSVTKERRYPPRSKGKE